MSILVVVLAGFAAITESSEEKRERYLRFAAEGIADIQRVSNEEVWRMLREGVASDDRRIVDLTLLALSNLTMLYGPELRAVQSNPWNSDRQIARVPGLKRFLMAHWREHAAGRDHETPMTDIRRPEWFGPWPAEDYPPEIKDGFWAAFVHAPQWRLIPNVLATHWPDDSEVLTLIWEARDHLYTLPDTDPDAYAARLFDMGKFDTPEVNSLRGNGGSGDGR